MISKYLNMNTKNEYVFELRIEPKLPQIAQKSIGIYFKSY